MEVHQDLLVVEVGEGEEHQDLQAVEAEAVEVRRLWLAAVEEELEDGS